MRRCIDTIVQDQAVGPVPIDTPDPAAPPAWDMEPAGMPAGDTEPAGRADGPTRRPRPADTEE